MKPHQLVASSMRVVKPVIFGAVFFGMAFGAATVASAEVNSSRIASVDANATEILIGFGLEENLVAADVSSHSLLKNEDLPDLGYHRALSAEGLLSFEPTLIVGSDHMGPPTVVDALEKTKIPLIKLVPASTVDGLVTNIELLGDQLGHSTQAQALVSQVRDTQSAIFETVNGRKPKMIFILSMTGRGLSKAGEGTTGDALIQLLGGENMTTYSGYKTLSTEGLLATEPDIILVGSIDDGVDAADILLAANPLLEHLTAVKAGRLLNVDASKMVAGVSLGVLREAERLSHLVY